MSASVIAPALPQISHVLHINASTTQITMSIYLLGFAVGPLIIAPWSEAYGRRPLWLGSQVFFIVWNVLCPVGDSLGVMVLGRFMSGIGGSGGPIVSYALVSLLCAGCGLGWVGFGGDEMGWSALTLLAD
jgi:predicted MFS family arabinose efflux permease